MHDIKLALVCDFAEEKWPSMDLVAEMLVQALRQSHGESVEVTTVRPAMTRRMSCRESGVGGRETGSAGTRQKAEGRKQNAGASPSWRFNADRLLNRFWDYPRFVRRIKNDFDLFHVVDHSYAQLVHQLPAERTIVSCHDLDTFRCLLNPEREPRSVFFKAMMRRTLNGLRMAAFVTCDSEATRDELLEHKLIAAERLAIVRNGVHPSCSPEPNAEADEEAAELLQEPGVGRRRKAEGERQKAESRDQRAEVRDQRAEGRGQTSEGSEGEEGSAKGAEQFGSVSPHPNPLPKGGGTSIGPRPNTLPKREGTSVSPHHNPLPMVEGTFDLLHVGSTIPRKRIDLLLRIFAGVKRAYPDARLLRVGGDFTDAQERLAHELGVRESIVVMPSLTRDVLAAVYRRATLVLLPSEREGFGLPVVEAMACGTPVVVSDLSVLHEVGGDAAVYCPIDNIARWVEAISELIFEAYGSPETWAERQTRAIAQAAKFSWAEYANTMVGIYQEVLRATVSGDKRVAVADREFKGLVEKVARSS